MTDRPPLVSIGKAAKRLRVPVTTLRSWADKGKIEYVKTPTGNRLFDPEVIDQFAESMAHLGAPLPSAPRSDESENEGNRER